MDVPHLDGAASYWKCKRHFSLASPDCACATMAAPRRTVACLLLLALCALAPVADAKKKRSTAVHSQMAPAPAPVQAIGRALLQGANVGCRC